MEETPLTSAEPSTIANQVPPGNGDTVILVDVSVDNEIPPPANTAIQSGVPATSGIAPATTAAVAGKTASPKKVRITDCPAIQLVCSIATILALLPLVPFTAGTVMFDDCAIIAQYMVHRIFGGAKKNVTTQDNTRTAAGKKKCPAAKSGLSFVVYCTYIFAPSLMLLPLTAGAFIWAPGAFIGHIVLKLAMPSPFGDAYRTTPIESSSLVGAVGGAALAGAIVVCMVASGLLVGTCLAVYRKLRGRPTSPSKILAHIRDKQTKSTALALNLAIRLALFPVAGYCGARLLHSVNSDYQTLDSLHVVLASMCWQLLLFPLELLSVLKYRRKAASATLPTVDSENAGSKDMIFGEIKTVLWEGAGKDMEVEDNSEKV